ncbi:TIGR04283 family arsenosugar biosynthesis glycosyltransferase [soil metagenome]
MGTALLTRRAPARRGTRRAAASHAARKPFSIIVPVLNEGAAIRPFLKQLRGRASGAEIIVADGGSTDETREVAAGFCDEVVTSSPGRAAQMAAGAAVAAGDVLWFLHADVEVPERCLAAIEEALTNPSVVGGYFRIKLPRPQLVYRLTDSFAHYGGMLLRVRCGDHGFFCRRSAFERVGGIPRVGFMEDVEFYRALARCGRMVAIEQRMIVSPRRYEAVGPLRLTLAFGLIALLYAIGIPRRALERLYNRFCLPRAT